MNKRPHLGVDRRHLFAATGALAASTALRGAPQAHAVRARVGASAPVEPGAGAWKTWVLTSGSQFRVPAPPDRAATELELRSVRAERTAVSPERIAYWDAGAPGYRWNQIAISHGQKAQMTADAYRMMALLNVAIYDATIAAWDSKYAHGRPRPGDADPTLETVVVSPASPAYPSEHAVTAGAAATVLTYLLPDLASRFAELAEEAGRSRVAAGVQYPSDVAAGLDLGRKVGTLVVDQARRDGSDAVWSGTFPTGPGVWWPDPGTNGFAPLAGTWKTWALTSGSQFRPDPPPAHDSAQRAAEIAEVRDFRRNTALGPAVFHWAHDPAGRPAPGSSPFTSDQIVYHWAPLNHLLWGAELATMHFEHGLATNAPRAARAYALTSVATYDATVAAWDCKYHYMVARPVQFDPTITTSLPTYNHPDYTSGHTTIVGASSAMLGYLFPADAECFRSLAEEMAMSRIWAGIHFRSATEGGLALGRRVARAVSEWAQRDGST